MQHGHIGLIEARTQGALPVRVWKRSSWTVPSQTTADGFSTHHSPRIQGVAVVYSAVRLADSVGGLGGSRGAVEVAGSARDIARLVGGRERHPDRDDNDLDEVMVTDAWVCIVVSAVTTAPLRSTVSGRVPNPEISLVVHPTWRWISTTSQNMSVVPADAGTRPAQSLTIDYNQPAGAARSVTSAAHNPDGGIQCVV